MVSNVKIATESGETSSMPVVHVALQQNSGQVYGGLVFGLIDAKGWYLDPPGRWGFVESLTHRVRNRLSPRIRSQMFGGAAYQIQLFASSEAELKLSELQEFLVPAIPRLRQVVLNGASK